MGEVHYMISEAAKKVGVEAHVLRYWEEELDIPISRTEMGHRSYTEEDIRLFCCIKDLKNQNIQLKELKDVVPEIKRAKEEIQKKRAAEATEKSAGGEEAQTDFGSVCGENPQKEQAETAQLARAEAEVVTEERLIQARNLIGEAIQKVLVENNELLAGKVSAAVTKNVMDEMGTYFRSREVREEERYRKLDNLIRQQQQLRREAAKSSPVERLRRIFQS